MISLEQALERILSTVQPVGSEKVRLGEASGRFLAVDVASTIDLPLFDNSAMDGYAVRSDDLKSASSENPVALRLIGRVAAGEQFSGTLASGECVRLFTGSPLPRGANAVVMQEDVESGEGEMQFVETARPFENVRLRGEDLRPGARIGRKGDRVNAARAGVIAACGVGEVTVACQPVVALLATGSELRESGTPLRPGEIYESNRSLLAALLAGLGCKALSLPLLGDDLQKTVQGLEHAFESAAVVITTGGVSVGEFDFVKEAFARIGGSIDLWRVALRPGKPFVFGQRGTQHLYGLPGNPVSTLVTFLLLVRPALLKMQQSNRLTMPMAEGRLTEEVLNRGDRRHFMRVRWENGEVKICGPQASHMISSLIEANGLIDVPPGGRLPAGATVNVHLWEFD